MGTGISCRYIYSNSYITFNLILVLVERYKKLFALKVKTNRCGDSSTCGKIPS